MAARRHNRTAPYEVMRGNPSPAPERKPAGRKAGSGWAKHAQARAGAGVTAGAAAGRRLWERLWPWLRGGGTPMVLHVPRGIAAVAVGGTVLLLVLSYWAGYSQGVDAGAVQAGRQLERQANRTAPSRFDGMAPGQSSRNPTSLVAGSSDTGGRPGPAAAPPASDRGENRSGHPRQAGLNYMILARYPEAAARELARFLKQRPNGVETVLEPLNNGNFLVIAAEKGLTGDELGGETAAAYRDRLETLGRAWRQHNNGQGDALGSMYFAKYTGS